MKRAALILALLLMPLAALAAGSDGTGTTEENRPDAGTWTYLAVKHAVTPRYTVTIRGELRTKDNARATDQRFVRIFNRYAFLPWLTGEVNFEGNQANLGDGQWRNAFRIHLGINAAAKLGDFRLSTLQREYFYIASNVEPAKPCFLLSQFRVGYAPKDWVATPYLTAIWISRPEIIQRRLIAGADIKLCPSASLNIYYMFKTAYPSGSDINVLGLGLTVTL